MTHEQKEARQMAQEAPFKRPLKEKYNTIAGWHVVDATGAFIADFQDERKASEAAAAINAYNPERDAKQVAAVQGLVEALRALYLQSLQSDLNDHSNEYGREAIGLARAALAAYEASK